MNPLTKTLRYEIPHLHQELLEILKDFSVGMQTEKIRESLGKDLSKQIQTQVNNIFDRLQADFLLVVVGDFKRGKSTFINALLGQEIVTTNITPETVTINQIHYGSEHKIEACLIDGGRVCLDREELKTEQLNPIIERLSQKVTHLCIETPIEWLKGLCLVDTPGTGDIFQRFDRQVHDYLEQADAVIFLISALSPLSASEQAFLQLSVLPQDFPKVFLVVNMMDISRSNEEAERLLTSIRAKIAHLFPNTRLFALSAFDEFCRRQSLPRPNPERGSTLAEAFQTFRDCLEESILLNRDAIQLNRANNQMERTLQRVESKIILLRNTMQSEQVRLGHAIAECEDESSALFAKIKQHQQVMRDDMDRLLEQACNWMSEFMARLETEVIAAVPNYSSADLRRHYHFFLTDSLCQALSSCLDGHRSAMIESADKVASAIAEEFHSLTDMSIAPSEIAKATFGEQQWTNLDTLQLVIGFSPLKFIADLLINQVRESDQSSKSVGYQQRLKNALPRIKCSVLEQMQSLYRHLAEQIEQQLETAYKQEIETSLLALKQAQEIFVKGEQQVGATNAGLQEALSLVADTRLSLKDFKHKLWSDLGG